MISALLAAVLTFTATATGVEKGTPLEFLFAAKDTDRDYETMFLLDESVDSFLSRIEKAGLKRGVPTNPATCRLWPVGISVQVEPPLGEFVDTDMPEGMTLGPFIYTGGTRLDSGFPDAATNMPGAVFALYSLSQSPFVFDGIYEQGVVYGAHKAKVTLKKGEKRQFKLIWNEKDEIHSLSLVFNKGNLKKNLEILRDQSKKSSIDVLVSFADDLTVAEATAVANALATIDSVRIKINCRQPGNFFYRAFLPLVKWRDRQERMTQPFEVTLGNRDKVVFIEEDWSVEGNDPKLTEKAITYEQMSQHPRTDTVFFFARKESTIGELKRALKQVPQTVFNHYVYWE